MNCSVQQPQAIRATCHPVQNVPPLAGILFVFCPALLLWSDFQILNCAFSNIILHAFGFGFLLFAPADSQHPVSSLVVIFFVVFAMLVLWWLDFPIQNCVFKYQIMCSALELFCLHPPELSSLSAWRASTDITRRMWNSFFSAVWRHRAKFLRTCRPHLVNLREQSLVSWAGSWASLVL